MIYIEPFDLTLRNFTISIPEADAPVWVAGSYALGAQVIKNHIVYQSAIATNTTDPAVVTIPPNWTNQGATNAYAIIDSALYTQTAYTNTFNFSFYGDFGNILFLQNCDFSNLHVKVVKRNADGMDGAVLYESDLAALLWFTANEWVAGIRKYKTDIAIYLPLSMASTVYVTVTKTGGTVKVGSAIFGYAKDIGRAVADNPKPEFSFVDMQFFTRDTWGNLTVSKKEVPVKLTLGVYRVGSDIKYDMSVMRYLKQKIFAWLPMTTLETLAQLGYGEIRDEYSITGAMTEFKNTPVFGLYGDKLVTIESAI